MLVMALVASRRWSQLLSFQSKTRASIPLCTLFRLYHSHIGLGHLVTSYSHSDWTTDWRCNYNMSLRCNLKLKCDYSSDNPSKTDYDDHVSEKELITNEQKKKTDTKPVEVSTQSSNHSDYDLNQLLKNIEQAKLNTETIHKTSDSIHKTETRTSPFTIEELVEFLKDESAEDVCVISVPPEKEYVKYFVTCVGVGGRHIKRMADNLAAECKKVRDESGVRLKVTVEGKESEDWVVVFLGDTVVHFMTEETRQLYELEQLWTLGRYYDNQYRRMEITNLESDALR